MELYHGTSIDGAKGIKREGLHAPSYVTTDPEWARYFASRKAAEAVLRSPRGRALRRQRRNIEVYCAVVTLDIPKRELSIDDETGGKHTMVPGGTGPDCVGDIQVLKVRFKNGEIPPSLLEQIAPLSRSERLTAALGGWGT